MTDKQVLIKVAKGIYELSPGYTEKLNELAEILAEAIIYDHRRQVADHRASFEVAS